MEVDSDDERHVNNVNSFKCISANVDSLLNKRHEMRHMFVKDDPDIVFVSEILPKNLKDPLQPSEIAFEGYDCFTNCFSEYVHLGTALYIKKSLNAQQVCLTKKQEEAKESTWVEIRLQDNEKLILGSIYRPPSNTKEENKKLYDTILELIGDKDTVLIAGDFNQPNIDWEEETSQTGEESQASVFLEFVRDSFLYQHVKSPTHCRGTQNPTLIDLIFSSEINMVQNIRHLPPIGKSHHQSLYFDFVCSSIDHRKSDEKRYNFRKADFQGMRSYISELDLANKIIELPVEDSWNVLKDSISESVEKHVPQIRPKSKSSDRRKKPRWWNCNSEKAIEKIKQKSEAYFKWRKTLDKKDYNQYAKFRNQAKRECKKADMEYEKSIAKQAKTNPKVFYSFANSKMKVKENIGDLIDTDGNKISSNSGKAEILNKFFCSVFTQEKTDNIPKPENRNENENIDNVIFTKDKVLKKLKDINSAKAGGPDGIQAAVLKELCNELCEPLSILFQKSMEEGKLPADWKDANVSPIFKKGDKSKPNNYRPVSLTCLLCKVMESIIRDTLFTYLEKK